MGGWQLRDPPKHLHVYLNLNEVGVNPVHRRALRLKEHGGHAWPRSRFVPFRCSAGLSPGLRGSRRLAFTPTKLVGVGKPGIFSCYSFAYAIQPEKYPPCSSELSRLWNPFRPNLFSQPEPHLSQA